MRKIIIATFILITFSSCSPYAVPPRIKRELYCYNGGEPTGIDSLIKINGYYIEQIKGNDTLQNSFIFFNDGIFIREDFKGTDSPSQYLKTLAKYSKLPSGRYFNFGIYKVSSDTIKAQILRPGSSNTYYANEAWFKIVNQTSIKGIYTKALGVARLSETYYNSRNPAIFIKASDTLPVSNAWLKKKKWFWCKDAWKKRKQTK